MPRSAAILAGLGLVGMGLLGMTVCAVATPLHNTQERSMIGIGQHPTYQAHPLRQAGSATRMAVSPADMAASRTYAVPVRIAGSGPNNKVRIGYLHTGPHLGSGSYPIYASAEGGSILGIVTLDTSQAIAVKDQRNAPARTEAVLTEADGEKALVEGVTMFGASQD